MQCNFVLVWLGYCVTTYCMLVWFEYFPMLFYYNIIKVNTYLSYVIYVNLIYVNIFNLLQLYESNCAFYNRWYVTTNIHNSQVTLSFNIFIQHIHSTNIFIFCLAPYIVYVYRYFTIPEGTIHMCSVISFNTITQYNS